MRHLSVGSRSYVRMTTTDGFIKAIGRTDVLVQLDQVTIERSRLDDQYPYVLGRVTFLYASSKNSQVVLSCLYHAGCDARISLLFRSREYCIIC